MAADTHLIKGNLAEDPQKPLEEFRVHMTVVLVLFLNYELKAT